jgi:hypothetical protein
MFGQGRERQQQRLGGCYIPPFANARRMGPPANWCEGWGTRQNILGGKVRGLRRVRGVGVLRLRPVRLACGSLRGFAQDDDKNMQRQRQRLRGWVEVYIPPFARCAKDEVPGKGNSRSPLGMTTRKATAKASFKTSGLGEEAFAGLDCQLVVLRFEFELVVAVGLHVCGWGVAEGVLEAEILGDLREDFSQA